NVHIPSPKLQGGRGPAASINAINFINPASVARIEIVKGAAATTLFGSEASGGVVQIFTKQGESGKTKVTIGMTGGLNFWPKLSNAIRESKRSLDIPEIEKKGGMSAYNLSVSGGNKE